MKHAFFCYTDKYTVVGNSETDTPWPSRKMYFQFKRAGRDGVFIPVETRSTLRFRSINGYPRASFLWLVHPTHLARLGAASCCTRGVVGSIESLELPLCILRHPSNLGDTILITGPKNNNTNNK